MIIKFIFYGTLMNEELLFKITNIIPNKITNGYIYGSIIEIIDNNEPNSIFKYPAINNTDSKTVIICKLVEYELNSNQKNSIWEKLIFFEGQHFITKKIRFTSFSRNRTLGNCFILKKNFMFEPNVEIKVLKSISNTYLWHNKYS